MSRTHPTTPPHFGPDAQKDGTYALSILKSDRGDPSCCCRYFFGYDNPTPGEGRYVSTYMGDGDPLPSFEGEPKPVQITGKIDAFGELLWNALNEENKVSLFVRYIHLLSGESETRIYNKNV